MIAAALALALVAQQPDRHGEAVLGEPTYKGTTASAPIPAHIHFQNEGGLDGAGLCVICGVVYIGAYHQVGDMPKLKGSAIWKEAKKRAGGYHPEKLTRLVSDLAAKGHDYPITQMVGANPDDMDALSRKGLAFAGTMNTGQQYGYKRIAHMVAVGHYRKGDLAMIVDNNFPGRYSWMPAAEYDRRSDGWIVWFDEKVVRYVKRPFAPTAWLAWWPVAVVAVLLIGKRLLQPKAVTA